MRIIFLVCCLFSMPLHAAIVTFSESTLISTTDLSYDNNEIVIDNSTVTIDGEHSFLSLKIINGGVLTHSLGQSINITVVNGIEVDATSRIDASGKGLVGDSTTGIYTGGSHGGRGGDYSDYRSGLSYGSYQKPVTLGGGGRGNPGTVDARGGGAIKIVANELNLDGGIFADGSRNGSTYGGGAGGSIWLDIGVLRSTNGTAAIRANGANGHRYGGGGGGGRVAFYYQTLDGFSESSISASGGVRGLNGYKHGAPGTVYVKSSNTNDAPILTIKGHGSISTEMEVNEIIVDGLPEKDSDEILLLDGAALSFSQDHEFSQIEIKNNGVLTIAAAAGISNQGITLTADKITIDASSKIDVSGKGLVGDSTTGVYTGGSHGGRGGDYSDYRSGLSYGSYQEPVTLGGGGRGNPGTVDARGGGAIKIVANELNLDGGIFADGSRNGSTYGGGAGGSIWLDIGVLRSTSGTAAIRANGANGHRYGGGGGGGRVAFYYQTLDGFSESSISASGGVRGTNGYKYGAPGSVYIKQKLISVLARLYFNGIGDHSSRMNLENILGDGEVTAAHETLILDQATWLLEQNHEFFEIEIRNNSVLITNTANSSVAENIILKASHISIDETSRIDVSGKGLVGDSTAGIYTGGSHGGRGGNYSDYRSGLSYGSYQEPVTLGGGGRGNPGTVDARGGGAIKIVANELNLDGGIFADGSRNGSTYGGGAGGSIWLDIGVLRSTSGTAAIRANGANGHRYGGGGGGGRVAFYYQTLDGFSESSISASGGVRGLNGYKHGAPGTVYVKSSNTNDAPILTIKGHGSISTEMEVNEIIVDGLPEKDSDEILLLDGAALSFSQDHEFSQIEIKNNGVLTIAAAAGISNQGITLTADKITIDASSKIDVSGKGLVGDSTTGVYTGGSHGGRGGDYSDYRSGLSYGSYQEPVTLGGGGRGNPGTVDARGGGAIKIVANELNLDGGIFADGSRNGSTYGGGAGGSIWLDIGVLRSTSGTAAIRANGANGHRYGGGGGGGRVAFYYQTLDGFSESSISASGGVRGTNGYKYGAPGSVYIKQKLISVLARLYFNGIGDHSSRMNLENILGDGEVTAAHETLILDQATWLLEQNHEFFEIEIRNNSVLITNTANSSVAENIILKASHISIDETSRIDVSGKGLVGDSTAGIYTGGSHGGRGGNYSDYRSGLSYGSYQEPVTLGGGGRGNPGTVDARGGGAIKIVANELNLDGGIFADGSRNGSTYGGGAGGSIWLDIGVLRSTSGTAAIRANGANGHRYGGGGGGGRVAFYYQTLDGFSESSISASGGVRGTNGYKYGAPGSVYIKQKLISVLARLYFNGIGDHSSRMNLENILGDGEVTAAHETLILDQATWLLEQNHEFFEIEIRNNSVLITNTANSSVAENIILKASHISIDETSRIDVSGKGLVGDSTAGIYTGGSHGGRRGNYSDHRSDLSYGSYQEPVTLGGGGRGNPGTLDARGGGAIKIVANELNLDGGIFADGSRNGSTYGGGAGGSIWLDIGVLRSTNGTAAIRANGANGHRYGGGGGGGRVAFYYQTLDGFSESSISASG